MTFYKWITSNYKKQDNRFGDLVKDMIADHDFPRRKDDRKIIKDYLYGQGAITNCIDTFNDAFDLYEKEMKNKK